MKYGRTPLIRTLVIRIADYTDRLGPLCKFVQNSTELIALKLSDQVQNNVTASRTSNQAWSKSLDASLFVYVFGTTAPPSGPGPTHSLVF